MQKFFLCFSVRPNWQVSSSVSGFLSDGVWTASKGHVILKRMQNTTKPKPTSVVVSCKFSCGGNGAWKLREFGNHALCCGISEPAAEMQYQGSGKTISRHYTTDWWIETWVGSHGESWSCSTSSPWAVVWGFFVWNSQTTPVSQTHHKLAAFSSLAEEVGPD